MTPWLMVLWSKKIISILFFFAGSISTPFTSAHQTLLITCSVTCHTCCNWWFVTCFQHIHGLNWRPIIRGHHSVCAQIKLVAGLSFVSEELFVIHFYVLILPMHFNMVTRKTSLHSLKKILVFTLNYKLLLHNQWIKSLAETWQKFWLLYPKKISSRKFSQSMWMKWKMAEDWKLEKISQQESKSIETASAQMSPCKKLLKQAAFQPICVLITNFPRWMSLWTSHSDCNHPSQPHSPTYLQFGGFCWKTIG